MDVQKQQRIQYDHDLRNHFDILALSRADRLKHYGLHFAKYVGRLARGAAEPKTRTETLVDGFLVSLSAANALNQALPAGNEQAGSADVMFFDQAGRFADACEKIDHLEEFRASALTANANIFCWLLRAAQASEADLEQLAADRRVLLAARAVYAQRT